MLHFWKMPHTDSIKNTMKRYIQHKKLGISDSVLHLALTSQVDSTKFKSNRFIKWSGTHLSTFFVAQMQTCPDASLARTVVLVKGWKHRHIRSDYVHAVVLTVGIAPILVLKMFLLTLSSVAYTKNKSDWHNNCEQGCLPSGHQCVLTVHLWPDYPGCMFILGINRAKGYIL